MNPIPDTVDLLTSDHDTIRRMFEAYKLLAQNAACDSERSAMLARICLAISIHAQIESELFYPAVRSATGDHALMDRAEAAQLVMKDLIAELMAMNPQSPHHDGKVTELGVAMARHAEQQEGDMFPKARAAGLDQVALRAQMEERQRELRAEQATMQDRLAQEDEAGDPVGHQ